MSDKHIVYTTTGAFIVPYEPNQSPELEYDTSEFDKIYHRQIPHTGFYNDKLGIFVTYRMYEPKLKSYFPGYDVMYYKNYGGKKSMPFKVSVVPNKYQNSVLTQLMGLKNHEAYVNIPTASGKTVLAVMYIAEAGIKTFVMCYSTRILEQWIDTFKTKTDLPESRICMFESSKLMNKLLKDKKEAKKYDIFLCTSSMFDAFGSRYGYENYQRLFENLGIGIKIIDEAHTRLGATVRCNAYTSIDKTLYLSADYNQSNASLLRKFNQVFKAVPVLRLEEDLMSELRHISAMTIIYNSVPSVAEHAKITNNKYHWSHIEFCKYEFEKDILKNTIVDLVKYIIAQEGETNVKPFKILILLQLIEHVDSLHHLLSSIIKGRSIAKYHSMVEDKASSLDADIIVSTYKSFSTGLDVTNPQIKHVISTTPVDVVTANQSAGRCRPIPNTKSFFWMLQDFGFEYCSNNNIKVVKYLKTNKIGSAESYKISTLPKKLEDGDNRD